MRRRCWKARPSMLLLRLWIISSALLVVVLIPPTTTTAAAVEEQPIVLEDYNGNQMRYDPPFDEVHYSVEISYALRQRRKHGGNRIDALYSEAQWLVDLGSAHRIVLEEEEEGQQFASSLFLLDHEKRANFCFQSAIQIYQSRLLEIQEAETGTAAQLSDQQQTELATLNHHLGSAYFSLADIYLDDSTDRHHELAHEYTLQAHNVFQRLLLVEDSGRSAASFLPKSSQNDIELSYAHCCLRLGVALLSEDESSSDMTQEALLAELMSDPYLLSELLVGGDYLSDLLEVGVDAEQLQQLFGGVSGSSSSSHSTDGGGDAGKIERLESVVQQQIQQLEQAETYFGSAALEFYKAVNRERSAKTRVELQNYLANTLQHHGTALLRRGNMASAAAYMEKALHFYENDIVPALQDAPAEEDAYALERHDLYVAVAEGLYSLSDIYQQQGKYDDAKDRYQRSMEWYERYNLESPAVGGLEFFQTGDENPVEAFEMALQQYKEIFSDEGAIYDEEGYFDEATGETYYEKDDGYEADLHASIGALYMGGDDQILAVSHLLEAIRLYDLAGEPDGQNMASAKFNLAALRLRNGEYRESARLHGEALDIFHRIIGDGEVAAGGVMGLDEIHNLLQKRRKEQQSETDTSETIPTNPDPKAKNSRGQAMIIDIDNFLRQNDSLKEEL